MRNRQELATWLNRELESRGWTQSDLARFSGVHRAVISKIILGGTKPTPETMEAIARALKIPPEQVFRVAGLLPPAINVDEDMEKILHEASKLPKQDQEEVLAFIRMKNNLRKRK
jgi:transcriptional regulator with XRE-family HTH domain